MPPFRIIAYERIKPMLFLLMMETGYVSAELSTVRDEHILNIVRNEPDAVQTLYDLTHKALYGFILSITKDTHDTEDALQETFLAVYRSAGEYKPKGKPMAWIFTVARNAANAQLRKRRDHVSFEEMPWETEALAGDDNKDERLALKAALSVLSEEERQIVLLHAVSGFKNREIASAMKLPLNTVLSKYNRAIKKLRAELEREE